MELFKKSGNVVSKLIITLIALNIHCAMGMTVAEELTLTQDQKITMDLFKEDMMPYLKKDYMKTEAYLVKWLRAAKFDLKTAKRMLHNTLKWRAENKIDTILDENFSFWDRETPCYSDGVDNENRPVVSIDVGEWRIRGVIISGRREDLLRYEFRCMETANYLIKEAQLKGQNVTQGIIIMNLKGFNLIQHACMDCIPMIVEFITTVQHHYVGILYKLFLINTPAAFQPLLNVLKPVMNERLRNAFEIYGTNEKEWKKRILKEIPEDQLRPEFGGTKLDFD